MSDAVIEHQEKQISELKDKVCQLELGCAALTDKLGISYRENRELNAENVGLKRYQSRHFNDIESIHAHYKTILKDLHEWLDVEINNHPTRRTLVQHPESFNLNKPVYEPLIIAGFEIVLKKLKELNGDEA